MLRNSNSRQSIFTQSREAARGTKPDSLQVCKSIQETLEDAARTLPQVEFSPILEQTMKRMILKAEVESPNFQAICLEATKQCLALYGGSLELNVRALLLEILSDLSCNILQEIPAKLDKAKHIVLQTQIEYLLSKIFLLEEKYFLLMGEEGRAVKSLGKCLQLNENHMIEFVQEEQQIRKQIVDYAIVAYYQYFKIAKHEKALPALDHLLKACNAAKMAYGRDHKITNSLFNLHHQQQNLLNSNDQTSVKSRAITDIFDYETKNNYRTVAFYSWEDDRIVVQIFKGKGKQKEVVSQNSYEIKLDMGKIRLLQSSEWLTAQRGGKIIIHEEELLRILGLNNNESQQKQMTTTGIELKNLSREQIIKEAFLNSSEDDEEFFSKQQLNILKFPRAQSSRKFKQTH